MTDPAAPAPDLSTRLPALKRRNRLTQATRAFFTARFYTEVETPYAVATPGEEVHLRVFETEYRTPYGTAEKLRLHTSPEFGMKKLLAAGSGPIFQLARVWRNEEGSETHSPEFTMLEWYAPGASLADLMDETEAYLRATLPPTVTCRGVTTSLHHFERLTVAQAFARYCNGADVIATEGDAPALAAAAQTPLRPGETWEDLFFRLLLTHIEPHLGQATPTFLTHYPASQAALARRDPTDPRVALRFEIYICGMELANAFEELADPAEQRSRFLADRARRDALGGQTWPLDEELLKALETMPPCSGIALGFDRLAMIAAGADRIDQVLWLPTPRHPI